MPSKNSYAVFVRAAVLSGVRGRLLKTVTSKSPLLSIMRQKNVRSASRIRVKLIKRPGRHVFVFELESSTLVLFAYDSIASLYNCMGHARVFVVLLKGKWIQEIYGIRGHDNQSGRGWPWTYHRISHETSTDGWNFDPVCQHAAAGAIISLVHQLYLAAT